MVGELRRLTLIRETDVLRSMQRSYLNYVDVVPSGTEFEVIEILAVMMILPSWTLIACSMNLLGDFQREVVVTFES